MLGQRWDLFGKLFQVASVAEYLEIVKKNILAAQQFWTIQFNIQSSGQTKSQVGTAMQS